MTQKLEGVDGRLREQLAEVARARSVMYYSQLEPMLKLDMANPNDRRRVGEHLGAVARFEVAQGRAKLSSVVWYRDLSTPGPGLFKLAVELGLAGPDADEMQFVLAELNRTHDYWAAH